MKALQIIEAAYRGTLEEQDDTIVWLSHSMRGIGADIDVLLCGNAVNYALQGQAAPALQFGGWEQSHAPDLAGDVAKLIEKGVKVYAMADDLKRRGLQDAKLISDIRLLSREKLPGLFVQYDQIWSW